MNTSHQIFGTYCPVAFDIDLDHKYGVDNVYDKLDNTIIIIKKMLNLD